MKKTLILFFLACVTMSVLAYEYIPKNVNENPFGNQKQQINTTQTEKANTPVKNTVRDENTEIKNLTEYFQYLPYAVNKNWIPYKANADYEVCVQFRVHNDGHITDTEIVSSTNERANTSVLNAVKNGAPYKPLPKSYPSDTVRAQVILEYHK